MNVVVWSPQNLDECCVKKVILGDQVANLQSANEALIESMGEVFFTRKMRSFR